MKKNITINRPDNLDLAQIFNCGQCFRFDAEKNDGGVTRFSGIAYGKHISAEQNDKKITIYGINEDEYNTVWKHYFALDVDYKALRDDILSRFGDDPVIREAMKYGSGIRILRQEPWETVCSFIISQNNNIPRIKKIIYAICREFGEPVACGENTYYSFPTPEALFEAGEERIRSLKTGFRAKYIYDAAKKVSRGELDLSAVKAAPTKEALEMLMSVKGIGIKVASCAALFGFEKYDSFPVDIWVKRVLNKYYPDGLDITSLGSYAGIAQQYLFYYERYHINRMEILK